MITIEVQEDSTNITGLSSTPTSRWGRYAKQRSGMSGKGPSYSGPDGIVVLEDGRPFGVRRITQDQDCWLRKLNNGATMLDGYEFDFDKVVLKYTFNWHRHMQEWTSIYGI